MATSRFFRARTHPSLDGQNIPGTPQLPRNRAHAAPLSASVDDDISVTSPEVDFAEDTHKRIANGRSRFFVANNHENHCNIVVAMDETANTVTCAICLETSQNQSSLDSCSHCFCFECISNWSKLGRTNQCPLCKRRFQNIIMEGRKFPVRAYKKPVEDDEEGSEDDDDAEDDQSRRRLYHDADGYHTDLSGFIVF